MARTKQTARKSTWGKAPPKKLATKAACKSRLDLFPAPPTATSLTISVAAKPGGPSLGVQIIHLQFLLNMPLKKTPHTEPGALVAS